MEVLEKGYLRLLDLCGILAGCSIAVVAVLVTTDVVIRNIGIGNFPWLVEVSEYALYLSCFLAAPWVLSQAAHVRVDLLVNALSGKIRLALEVAIDVVGALVSLILFYYGLAAATEAHGLGSRIFKELVVAEWWLLSAIPLSCALLVIEFGRRIFRALHGDGEPRRPDALTDGL